MFSQMSVILLRVLGGIHWSQVLTSSLLSVEGLGMPGPITCQKVVPLELVTPPQVYTSPRNSLDIE